MNLIKLVLVSSKLQDDITIFEQALDIGFYYGPRLDGW